LLPAERLYLWYRPEGCKAIFYMDVENTKPLGGGFGRRHAGPAGIFGECQKQKIQH
jgi:hypothetical protein